MLTIGCYTYDLVIILKFSVNGNKWQYAQLNGNLTPQSTVVFLTRNIRQSMIKWQVSNKWQPIFKKLSKIFIISESFPSIYLQTNHRDINSCIRKRTAIIPPILEKYVRLHATELICLTNMSLPFIT